MGTATLVTGPAPSPQNGSSPNETPVARVTPFVRASSEHVEPLALDVTKAPAAGAQDLGVVPINAFGYLRGIWLLVEATGGTGTAAVYKEDAPWSALKSVSITDVNGGQLFGPLDGFECYLVHKYGGYQVGAGADPLNSPSYVAPTTAGNFAFLIRIPVEIAIRDAVGALPNANSSATFKLNVTLGSLTDIYSTNPTGIPNIRVRAWAEEWAQPEPALGGLMNEMEPPATGTTQYWNRQQIPINAGQFSPQLTRLGNYIRNLIFVARTATPARSDTMWPDPGLMTWDSVIMLNEPRALRKQYMRQRFDRVPETGVFVFDFTHDFDDQSGGELRALYLPTLTSSNIRVGEGVWGSAGTLTVLTNDIAVPAGESIFMD